MFVQLTMYDTVMSLCVGPSHRFRQGIILPMIYCGFREADPSFTEPLLTLLKFEGIINQFLVSFTNNHFKDC